MKKLPLLILVVLVLLATAAKAPLKIRDWNYLFIEKKVAGKVETFGVLNLSIVNRGDLRKFVNMWGGYDFVLKRGNESKKVSYQEIQEGLALIPKQIPFP